MRPQREKIGFFYFMLSWDDSVGDGTVRRDIWI